ncbi:MAG: hypothetical protein B5M56_07160 [Desulfococcus sp. 4484_241]|nr:MAG: hypothetical protein B5M56_07160 [Desulfococcus sp. 4484_241]
MHDVTGVILAGGESRRFGGVNKAFQRLGGVTMMDRVYAAVKSVCGKVVIVTNSPLDYLRWDAALVTDKFGFRGSLVGIHAGLAVAEGDYAFVTACDTPFLKKGVIEMVTGSIDDSIDIVVPEKGKWVEPLCAVYSKRCLKVIEEQLGRGELVIKSIYGKLRVKKISEKQIRTVDPCLVSFVNVNTKQELETAESLLASGNSSLTVG